MAPKKRHLYLQTRSRAWLYDFVFVGRVSILVTLLLLLSLFIQPVHKVFAQTEETAAEEEAETVASEEEAPTETAEDSSLEEAGVVDEADVLDLEAAPLAQTTELESSASTTETENDPDAPNSPTTEEVSSTTSATTTSQTETNSETEVTTEIIEDDVDSTEIEIVEATSSVDTQALVTEDNFYQFSRQSCVAAGSGSYYCATDTSVGIDEDSVVYADRGQSGNKEIFLKTTRGDVKQITDNNYEDSAPYYDPSSLQVVWQRLVEGREQIVLYDIREETETQLTYSRTNNMEPKVSTEGVVWQVWDGTDWEISYFDGQFTQQLTDNEVQDVAPVIEEGYVLWTVLGTKKQEAKVYSLESGEIRTIVGYEGGAIENPRFVLVYDTKYDNGDVVVQGFDPVTGVSTPISSSPAPQPIDIPDSDPIGEIRALVNNKSTDEEEFSLEIDDSNASSTLDISSSTSTVTGTLDLTSPDGEEPEDLLQLGTTTSPIEDFELTEYDLVLTPLDAEVTNLTVENTQ